MKKRTRIKSDYANTKTRKKKEKTFKVTNNQKENVIYKDPKMNRAYLKSPYLENLSCHKNKKDRPFSSKNRKFIIKLSKKKKARRELNNR